MSARKGGKHHRVAGQAYFQAMAVVAVTAVVMAIMRSGPFLLLVGVFSFYLAFTGLRAVKNKPPENPARIIDWGGAVAMLVGAVGLMVFAFTAAASDFMPVALTFAGIGGFFAVLDLYRFLKPADDPIGWRILHMIRMLSAYIATLTAFAVVNLKFLPTFVPWLLPTVLGSVGITFWVRHERMRFAARASQAPAAQPCADLPLAVEKDP